MTAKLRQNQDTRKQQYNKGTKQQTTLHPNEAVRVQVQNRWIPAKVLKRADTPNSYFIRCSNGTELCRNRKHLRRDQTNKTFIAHPTSWDYDNDLNQNELIKSILQCHHMAAHEDHLQDSETM